MSPVLLHSLTGQLVRAVEEARMAVPEGVVPAMARGQAGAAGRGEGAGRGWAAPWSSRYGSGFDYDFRVTPDELVPQLHCDYRPGPGPAGGR